MIFSSLHAHNLNSFESSNRSNNPIDLSIDIHSISDLFSEANIIFEFQ